MSKKKIIRKFSLPIEFDSQVKNGIALPPNIVLEYNTQYQKIIEIQRPNDATSVTGRIIPAPAFYHDQSVIILPEEWKWAYDFSSSSALCKLIEPTFAKKIKLKKLEIKESDPLPLNFQWIRDKSVLFNGRYFLIRWGICKVLSIDGGSSPAIFTGNTHVTFKNGSGGNNGKQFQRGNKKLGRPSKKAPKIQDRKTTFENLRKVKGIDDTIKRLQNEVFYPFVDILNGKVANPEPMGGVLLYGPPGCGKTEIAHSIAKDLGVYFDPIKIGDLASTYVHQFGKNLKARFDKAAEKDGGAIIFLDELDAFAGQRSNMDQTHDKENVNVLLQLLDPKNRSPNVLVIAATNYLSSLDTAVTRSGRFDTKIGIGTPDENGRAEILKSKLINHSLDSNSITNGVIQNIAKKTIGYVGADLKTLVDKAKTFQSTRARKQKKSTSSMPMLREDLLNALKSIAPLCKTEMNIDQPSVKKEDLPGSEEIVNYICSEIELMLNREQYRQDIDDVKPKQAFLLHGPPGTGKSSIANAVANEWNILFQVINAGELKSSLQGSTIKNINKLFENARLFRPILLFFDEIDSIAQHRSSNAASSSSDSINTLLTQLGDTIDNDDIILIAATNRKDMVDEALLRPGRFGTHIKVERPDLPNIKEQLTQQIEDIPNKLSKKEIKSLADSLFQEKKTQAEISDYLQSIKRHLVKCTDEGEKADFQVFKTILESLSDKS